jgi:hypothetical protein
MPRYSELILPRFIEMLREKFREHYRSSRTVLCPRSILNLLREAGGDWD